MSLKNGLNLKKSAAAPVRQNQRALFDEENDDDDEGLNDIREAGALEIDSFRSGSRVAPAASSARKAPTNTNKLPGATHPPRLKALQEARQDASSTRASQAKIDAAEAVDASIFDYDTFYDAKTTVTEAKKAAARQDAIERKPKYIDNLFDAAARRKQDLLVAKEKLLQREREAEGDEFADKEKFVTGAYKQQQEEARKLQEEEKKRAEQDELRRKQMGGGMQGFYRSMVNQQEQQYQDAVEAAAKLEREGGAKPTAQPGVKSDAELAAELKAKGINVHLNEEGQVTDKRELLAAGLNVAPSSGGSGSRGSEHLRTSNRHTHDAFSARNEHGKQAQRERQSRMMEEQIAAAAKRAREEEEEERAKIEKAAKSTKTEQDVSNARARFLARKAARQNGNG